MRKEIFENGEYYHIYNRGVDKRPIYLSDKDRGLFIELLAKCKKDSVDILAYCLMPNHFHLLLRQKTDRGISTFLHLLSTCYAVYFNHQYQRKGRLFEGPFKAEWINSQSYFIHISRYIHLNPHKLCKGPPRLNDEHLLKCITFLENYAWSSYKDYLTDTKLQSFLTTEPVKECFNDNDDYKNFVREGLILKYAKLQLSAEA